MSEDNTQQPHEPQEPEGRPSGSSDGGDGAALDEPSRRTFLKRAAIGGGATLAVGGATYGATQIALEGRVDENALETDETFKPMDQRDVILSFAKSKVQNDKHPERNEQYSRLL